MNKYLSSEQKIIGLVILATIAIFIVAIYAFSKNSPEAKNVKGDVIAQNGLHWHPKLKIYINGEKQVLPANIGILPAKHEPLHTHEDAKDDIVHMEFSGMVTKDDTKLGNFFKIWGKEFNSSQIFDKRNGTEGAILMTVNGKTNSDYGNYLMKDHDVIEIRFE